MLWCVPTSRHKEVILALSHRRRRSGLIALGAALTLACRVHPTRRGSGRRPAEQPRPPGGPTPGRRRGGHTVTLITGDKVTIGTAADGSGPLYAGRTAAPRLPPPVVDGATYVYPDSALTVRSRARWTGSCSTSPT